MTTTLMPEGRQRYFNNDGTPAAGCKLYTYAAGTTTPKDAYQDSDGLVPHQNPITLDAKGEAVIFWMGSYKVDLKTAAGAQITGYPVDNYKSDPGGLLSLFTSAGALLLGWIRVASGAVATTVGDWLGWQDISVFEFMTAAQIADVRARTLAIDVTTPIRNAIAHASASKVPLRFPRGWYKVSGSLTLTTGTMLKGSSLFPSDWRVPGMATTKIKLVTAAATDLFVVDQTALDQGYVWGMHVSGMTLEGSNVAGSRGMFLDGAASSTFENIGIKAFARGLQIDNAMMNSFDRINSSGCTESAFYISATLVTTSQVFTNCVARESPWGWILQSSATGYSIGTIFNNCLIESLTAGGISQHRSCSAEYIGIYAENVPDDRATTGGNMFNLFNDGVATSPFDSVAVFRGGDLGGGNFGLFSSSTSIDIGDAKFVSIDGTVLRRATNGIRVAPGAKDNSIYLNGPQFVQVTNPYVTTTGKVTGVYPNTGLAGSLVTIGDFGETHTPKVVFPAAQVASTDPNTLDDYEEGTFTAALICGTSGTITLGLSTLKYTKVGRSVAISGLLQVSSVSAPVGTLTLTGLPVAAGSGFESYSVFSVIAEFLNAVTAGSITGRVANLGTEITLSLYSNGVSSAMASAIKANSEITISGTYMV